VRSYADYSLFTYKKGETYMALLIDIDDLVLTGNNPEVCTQFKKYLNNCFQIKDLGPLKYFLSIEMTRGPRGLFLCQRKDALGIIEDCGLLGTKPIEFPMEKKSQASLG